MRKYFLLLCMLLLIVSCKEPEVKEKKGQNKCIIVLLQGEVVIKDETGRAQLNGSQTSALKMTKTTGL